MTQQFYPGYIAKKKTKIPTQKDKCISMLIAALFTMAKIWKQAKCPSADE